MRLGRIGLSAAFGAVMIAAGCTDQVVSRADAPAPQGPAVAVSTAGAATAPNTPRVFRGYLTGYTWWDNTPPGSSAIARPVLRQRAGGSGTWEDPITIAVGHRIEGGRQTLDFREGTRFYLPRLRKYAIVEDVCGDGNAPQLGPCHTGHRGHPWLDIWIGGRGQTPAAADTCARRITAIQDMVIHPQPGLPVEAGEIAANGCKVFG
ncbi:MAG TPA: hypothetical protein VLA78_10315 [Paracoccaceae bacterium]|nr:hypothetical protein [Paracoccaceae bacterium]